MTKDQLKIVLDGVLSWPSEDQEELVDIARQIEARRRGVYVMTGEERAAVEEGLAQVERGECVPDDEMRRFWEKSGAA